MKARALRKLRKQFYIAWNPAYKNQITIFDKETARSIVSMQPVTLALCQHCDVPSWYAKEYNKKAKRARATELVTKYRIL